MLGGAVPALASQRFVQLQLVPEEAPAPVSSSHRRVQLQLYKHPEAVTHAPWGSARTRFSVPCATTIIQTGKNWKNGKTGYRGTRNAFQRNETFWLRARDVRKANELISAPSVHQRNWGLHSRARAPASL